ncbi:MAG: peptide MFS transporter [Bacteroidales bacterium]|jgi:POT family proton-dependent oligopeptide transporter|nr:peptide MFS transporter [Bacteroidales bacterium]
MFKNHPKGLIVAFFTNMGERFGFYTMMAILVLFLQARYGLTEAEAGGYYSWFYFAIYALALIGGMLADWTRKYKLVILLGQIVMFTGYAIIAVPNMPLYIALAGLFTIALGNGLFKGNLQAVVGQMYDNEQYKPLRDKAYMLFYMGINIGAFFAPFIATGVRNWWLKINGLGYNGGLPALCHNMINGTITPENTAQMQELANNTMLNQQPVADLMVFAQNYIEVFARGYNWAFAIAACAMIVSLLVYVIFNKMLPNKEKQVIVEKDKTVDSNKSKQTLGLIFAMGLMAITSVLIHLLGKITDVPQLDYKLGLAIGLFVGFVTYMFTISTKEEKPRIAALSLVFVVVIFFWMSFHQNGLTLTLFARDYTVTHVGKITFLLFDFKSILCVVATIGGAVLALHNKKLRERIFGGIMFLVFGMLCYLCTLKFENTNLISPEVFQAFNPLYIVVLTPLVMGFFTWLSNKKKEPSTPKKIGFGMIIAALGFVVVLIASLKLVSPYLLDGSVPTEDMRVSPYWLLTTYFILTIAELFLSPMGLSFVSKVAPSRFQGLMQGGWLLATAVGNKLLFVGSLMWGRIDLYMLWGIFIICCILSALFIFSIMKRLEAATK